MNNELTQIIARLAKLSNADQLWILKQLSPMQRQKFILQKGNLLLSQANQFHKSSAEKVLPIIKPNPLPEVCETLINQDPLFIAIILEQGQFSWEHQFIQSCDQKDAIQEQLQKSAIKPATKDYVFQQWQMNLSFQNQLETANG